jgi:hypothetical protein
VTQAQANAAWSLYVEFATRITTAPLEPGSGSIREALDSVYALFGACRQVLRDAGPDVARGPNSLGPLVIRVLNEGLRPFLVKWHPALDRAAATAGAGWDEAKWESADDFYTALRRLTVDLNEFVNELGRIANVKG